MIDSLDIALEVMDNLMNRYNNQIAFCIDFIQVNMRTRMLHCPCGALNHLDLIWFARSGIYTEISRAAIWGTIPNKVSNSLNVGV